jgi:hypothetical protein
LSWVNPSVSSPLFIESANEELEPTFSNLWDSANACLNSLKLMQEIDFANALKVAPEKPGVYVLFENNKPTYVGRARKLRSRLKGHVSGTAQASTFAFVLARNVTGKKPSYKTKGSRADLLKNDPVFKAEFDKSIAQIRNMKIKYLEIENDNLQYFFEFYCAIELQTPHNKFRTT